MTTTTIKPLNSISTDNIQVTETGCTFSGRETDEEVLHLIIGIKRVDKAIPFILADTYNKHPEIIQNAYDPDKDGTGHYSIGSIKVYAVTLKDWPAEERRWDLGISFYQAVYHLPKKLRDELMNLAEIKGLSRNELRQEAKLLNNGNNSPLPATREDVEFEKDKYIYELEQKVIELEDKQIIIDEQDNPTDYNVIIANIIKTLQALAEVYPPGIQQIREYLENAM